MRYCILTDEQDENIDFTPTVIIGFYQSRHKTAFYTRYKDFQKRFPHVEVFGCSTESNIYNELPYVDIDDTRKPVFICLDMQKDAFGFECIDMTKPVSFPAKKYKKHGAIVLASYYDERLESLVAELPGYIGTEKIFGAIASSDTIVAAETEVFYNGTYYPEHMIVWLIDQKKYTLDGMSIHHFQPVGLELEVTNVKEKTLYSIDNRPALSVLEEMVGELLDETISSFNHPFFLKRDPKQCYDETPLCSIESIDRQKQSITLYRHLQKKNNLKVGISLKQKDQHKKLQQFYRFRTNNAVALMFNCIGVKRNLGMVEYLYLIDMKKHLNIPFIGFHSFGEIGPFDNGHRPILHNQTISIAILSEKV